MVFLGGILMVHSGINTIMDKSWLLRGILIIIVIIIIITIPIKLGSLNPYEWTEPSLSDHLSTPMIHIRSWGSCWIEVYGWWMSRVQFRLEHLLPSEEQTITEEQSYYII